MASEADGIDEALEGMLRVGLTAAGQLAEVAARAREQAARQARQTSEAQARELAARLQAERAAARAQLAPVDRSDWWNTARVDDVARMWETAAGWRGLDPAAERAADSIRDEVRSRYGVNLDAPGADRAAVRNLLERSGADDLDSAGRRADARRDEAAAVALLAAADRADRERGPDQDDRQADQTGQAGQPTAAGVADDWYDTADRRRELADALSGVADSEAVSARVAADTFQARPPQDAVASPPGAAAQTRRGARGAGRARQRGAEVSR